MTDLARNDVAFGEQVRPHFVSTLLDRHATRQNAFLVENAGYDYVQNGDSVLPIETFAGDLMLEQGCELVVSYSLAEGVRIYDGEGGEGEGAEQRERRLRALCGLRPARLEDMETGVQTPTFLEVMRGVDRLVRQAGTRIGILLKHADRLFPDVTTPGIQSQEQLA